MKHATLPALAGRYEQDYLDAVTTGCMFGTIEKFDVRV
jgi:hypothetical protein